jgi:hypothetical protein
VVDRKHLLDEMTAHRPPGETEEFRICRKAAAIRRALIEGGVVVSPEADVLFTELPHSRQVKWLRIATAYVMEM